MKTFLLLIVSCFSAQALTNTISIPYGTNHLAETPWWITNPGGITTTGGPGVSPWQFAQTVNTNFEVIKGWIHGGTNNQPTISAGAGAGTGGTATLDANASDATMTVSVASGTSPTASTVFTVTFGTVYERTGHVVFSAASPTACGVTANAYVDNVTTTGFAFKMNSSGLSGSTSYIWTFHVLQ